MFPVTKRLGSLFACVLMAVPSYETAFQDTRAPSLDDYLALVADYRGGRFAGAARALSGWSAGAVQEVREELRSGPPTAIQLEAAAMLHTEVVLLGYPEKSLHLDTARAYLGQIEPEARRRSFQRRWFLALGYFFQRGLRLGDARVLFETGLDVLPEDLEMRLALGTVEETAGWMYRDESLVKRAEKHYRHALESQPGLPEAQVRLGRVLALRGRKKDALVSLESALEETDDLTLRLIAHLVVGDLHRKDADFTRAVASYRAAEAIDPGCQSTAVALSHALHQAGDWSGSRRVLTRFFGRGEGSSRNRNAEGGHDPWWAYVLGHSDRADSMVHEMREAVRK
ncbi:MAG: hypothetical protein ACE5JI_19970 [Acidobacteriota bacterium]